jgi:hypothetical protein
MSNGKEISAIALNIIRGLVIAAILGVAAMAGTQLVLSNRVATAEEIQKKNQPVIDSVDVIKAAVVNLEKDIEKLDKKIDAQHKEVMAAIRASR